MAVSVGFFGSDLPMPASLIRTLLQMAGIERNPGPSAKFQKSWLDPKRHPDFHPWLRQVLGQPNLARCSICVKDFSLSNMGVQALHSHRKYKSHIAGEALLEKQPTVASLFRRSAPSSCSASSSLVEHIAASSLPVEPIAAPSRAQNLEHMYVKQDTVKAEILWCLKTVRSHHSYRSAEGLTELFRAMFPDSAIAKHFSLGRDKIAYYITYGLAPFFKKLLLASLADCECFVICFDEALNRISQRCQMDMVVRFWDSRLQQVSSRYLSSAFLTRSTAVCLTAGFKSGLGVLPVAKVLQISMDGPSVNWKFYKDMKCEMEASFIDTGSCGLHVVNGAFQLGHNASGWHLNTFFRSVYWLFKDSPARRAVYTETTGSDIFPLKFCVIRWTENSKVCDRVLKMLPFLSAVYVKNVKPKPVNANFSSIDAAITRDNLLKPKLQFFNSVSLLLEPFLSRFQTSQPMFPFLYESLDRVLRSLLARLVKPEVLAQCSSASKLIALDLSGNGDQFLAKVDIGFGAQACLNSSSATQLEKVGFFSDCRKFLIAIVKKIVDKSPLSYKCVRACSSLSPSLLATQPSMAKSRFQTLLESLVSAEKLSAASADKAKSQFASFCDSAAFDQVKSFDQSCRLDDFYVRLFGDSDDFDELFRVVKMVLMLSHGNAAVESGFSVNSDIMCENLHEDSLVAQRIVYDAVHTYGGPSSVPITADMMKSVSGAPRAYRHSLDAKQSATAREAAEVRRAEKRVKDQIDELRAKRSAVIAESQQQQREIEIQMEVLRRQQ